MKHFLPFLLILLIVPITFALEIDTSITFLTNASNITYVPVYDFTIANVTLSTTYLTLDEVNFTKSNATPQNVSIFPVNLYIIDAPNNSSLTTYALNVSGSGVSVLNAQNADTGDAKQLMMSQENYSINILASGYAPYANTFNTSVANPDVHYFYLNRYMALNIYNESDGDLFQINSTSGMTLTIFCDDVTLTYEIQNQSQVIEACAWTDMKLEAFYPSASYFRTLVNDLSVTNVSFYMADANVYTLYQIIMRLNDLTGQYVEGYIELTKIVNTTDATILSQYWDAEAKTVLYLIKDNFYTLTLRSPDGVTRSLGYFIADSAGEKRINVPDVSFVPDTIVVGDKVKYGWSGTSALMQFYYNDTTNSATTNVTMWVRILNGSNTTVYNHTTTDVTASLFSVIGNSTQTYLACFEAINSLDEDFASQCAVFTGFMPPVENAGNVTAADTAWGAEGEATFFKWIIVALIMSVLIYIGSRGDWGAGIGLGITGILLFASWKLQWFVIVSTYAHVAVIALCGFGAAMMLFVAVNKQ